MWNSWFKSVCDFHSSYLPVHTDELTEVHEVRKDFWDMLFLMIRGEMDNVLSSEVGDLFKGKRFLWFSQKSRLHTS